MARLGSSVDIGEELESSDGKDSSCGYPSAGENASPGQGSGQPNVALKWGRGHDHGSAPLKASLSKTIAWSALAILLVLFIASGRFTKTEDFPGIDSAVRSQMEGVLSMDLSRQIADDYLSVSEARKRYMFNQKFDEVSKSQAFKQIVSEKQESTKDLFRDRSGMPYLYTPEAYRFVEAAQEELEGRPLGRFSDQDVEAGHAIALFHRYSWLIRPYDSVEWAGFYLPVAVGLIVVFFACLTALALARNAWAPLFAGLAIVMHPFAAAMFSAGLPHYSVVYLIPFWIAASMLAVAGWIHGWASIVPLAIVAAAALSLPAGIIAPAGHIVILVVGVVVIDRAIRNESWPKAMTGSFLVIIGLISVYYLGRPSHGTLIGQFSVMGRGLSALGLASLVYAVWCLASKKGLSRTLACAASLAVGSAAISSYDPSGILPLVSVCVLVGVAGSEAAKAVSVSMLGMGGKDGGRMAWAVCIFVALLIAGASFMAAGASQGVIMPGVDDSLANISSSLRVSAMPGSVFIADQVTSDPIMRLSGVSPALTNLSDSRISGLLASALMSGDENASRSYLKALACPAVHGSIMRAQDLSPSVLESIVAGAGDSCPPQAYLILTDRVYSWLGGYASDAGIDTLGQKTVMPSSCEVLPQGGISCTNGMRILDLNATLKGQFPARMVSFIGNKRIVEYPSHRIDESFVIYRENGKLFSLIVPSMLDSTLLVRAFGHDSIAFLSEVASSDSPTHAVLYQLVEPGAVSSSDVLSAEVAEDVSDPGSGPSSS